MFSLNHHEIGIVFNNLFESQNLSNCRWFETIQNETNEISWLTFQRVSRNRGQFSLCLYFVHVPRRLTITNKWYEMVDKIRNWKLIVRMTGSTEHVYGVFVLFVSTCKRADSAVCACRSCFIAISTWIGNNNFFHRFFLGFYWLTKQIESNRLVQYSVWIEIREIRCELCPWIKAKLSSLIKPIWWCKRIGRMRKWKFVQKANI